MAASLMIKITRAPIIASCLKPAGALHVRQLGNIIINSFLYTHVFGRSNNKTGIVYSGIITCKPIQPCGLMAVVVAQFVCEHIFRSLIYALCSLTYAHGRCMRVRFM